MTIEEIIRIIEQKAVVLSQLKASAVNGGDLEQVIKLEEEEAATTLLIAQLKRTQSGM